MLTSAVVAGDRVSEIGSATGCDSDAGRPLLKLAKTVAHAAAASTLRQFFADNRVRQRRVLAWLRATRHPASADAEPS
jgi:hypothetical protein